jgi:hypothetical protein
MAVLALVAAGCGDDDTGPALLILPTTVGTAVVDGDTGARELLLTGSTSTPDGDVLFEARSNGGSTFVGARTVRTFNSLWSTDIEGSFESRVANADGTRVVLGPSRAGVFLPVGTLAPGRTETTLAVVGDGGSVDELTVTGNVEPEGFSVDGDSLFVVNYLPAEAPTYYQVKQLDLATGELHDVFSVDEALQETMRGTARTQTWDPEGDRLYTLYTLDGGGAFVHVLDLDEEWAHCVDLPFGIAATSAGMALSSDGRTLYVADGEGSGLAEVDTESLAVTEEGTLPRLGVAEAGAPTAVAIDGRRLLVGHGRDIDVLDRGSFEALDRFEVGEPLVGVQVEGDEVFVAQQGSVAVLDAGSGEEQRVMPIRLDGGAVLSLGPTSIPTYAGIQCAC